MNYLNNPSKAVSEHRQYIIFSFSLRKTNILIKGGKIPEYGVVQQQSGMISHRLNTF